LSSPRKSPQKPPFAPPFFFARHFPPAFSPFDSHISLCYGIFMSYAATFDTYKVIKRISQLATKADIKAEVAILRSEIAGIKVEIIKWMFGGFLALIGLSVAILLKIH